MTFELWMQPECGAHEGSRSRSATDNASIAAPCRGISAGARTKKRWKAMSQTIAGPTLLRSTSSGRERLLCVFASSFLDIFLGLRTDPGVGLVMSSLDRPQTGS